MSVLYAVVTTSRFKPTDAQIKAGTAPGQAWSGSSTDPDRGPEQFSVTGLTIGEYYYSYFVQETDYGFSNVLVGEEWQASYTYWDTLTTPTETSITDTTATIGCTVLDQAS